MSLRYIHQCRYINIGRAIISTDRTYSEPTIYNSEVAEEGVFFPDAGTQKASFLDYNRNESGTGEEGRGLRIKDATVGNKEVAV